MGYEFDAKVQTSGITKEQFINKMVEKKVKEEKAASIFEQFNTNQAADAKGQQVLDQNEQVGLMSFFKQLAGGGADDTKVTRKDFRHNKAEAGVVDGAKYKDYKRAMEAYSEILAGNNAEETSDDENVTFGENNTIVTQGEGEEAISTTYTMDKNNVTKSEASDGSRTETLEYTNGKVSNDKVDETKDGVTTTTVNGTKTQTVEQKDGKTITTTFSEGGGVRKTEDPNANTITFEEFSGESPDAGQITKKTVINTQDKTATVVEGNTTTKYEGATDQSNLGTVVETTVVDGQKTVNTNLKTHTRTTTDKADNSVKTEYMKDDNQTLTKTVTKQGDSTKTEFYNDDGSAVSRTVTKGKSQIVFNDGGQDTSFKLDKDGNITAYAKYENGKYETLDQAAQRLGFKPGSEEYKAFINANGGKADGYLRAGQALKIGSDIATSTSFNLAEAKTDRQTQINNWRAANPEKAAAAAAKRQGIDNLRQTFATKNFQVYYDPAGEQKSRIDGQGKTGGTHYIYQNGKLVNLEDHLKSKGIKLAEGEHIIRIGEDGTVRTNKNQFYKLDGQKSDQASYNKSFKAGHAASGGVIKDVNGKELAKTQVTQETGTPESKQYKQMLSAYNNAKAAFDQQMKKDGWAADVADGIAHLWNNDLIELTGNTADMVRRDLAAYNEKLTQLKTALDNDDMETFHKLYNELQSSNISARVADYNQSQDDGAAAVKTTAVIAASTAAAIATGGSSLVVQAGVAGGVAAATRFGTEVSDLATNDIDGDINAQSLNQIAEQAVVDGVVTAVTVGAARGVGNMMARGSTAATSDAGSAIVRAGTESADDVGSAIVRAGTESADDVGGAVVRSSARAGAESAAEGAAEAGARASAEGAAEAGARAGAESAAEGAAEAGARAGAESAAEGAAEAGARAGAEGAAESAAEAASRATAEKLGMSAEDVSFIKNIPSNIRDWTPEIKNKLADILGIRPSDIGYLTKAQYRDLAIKFHPDRNGSSELAQQLFQLVGQIK